MSYTTHLVCAPDDLNAPAVVMEWLVPTGSEVQADVPLVRLAVAGISQLVMAPLAGVLTEHCVAIGEPLASSDLLAMIEAEEAPFGMSLLPEADVDEILSVPACRLGTAKARAVVSDTDALALCAVLGVAPDEIPRLGDSLSREDVEHHVRRELRALAAIRELLQK